MVIYSKVEIRSRLSEAPRTLRKYIHTLDQGKAAAVAPSNMNVAAVIHTLHRPDFAT